MSRTGRQRLDDIAPAIARKEEFFVRVKQAEGDVTRCADLMAEAIEMVRESGHIETVSKSGKVTVCIEEIMAGHCASEARDAYLRARGSNSFTGAPPK